MFENFDTEDAASLEAATLNLETYLMSIDLRDKVDERAVTLPKLTEERLGSISPTEGADLALQVPVGVSGISIHDFDTNLSAVSETNYILFGFRDIEILGADIYVRPRVFHEWRMWDVVHHTMGAKGKCTGQGLVPTV